MARPITIDYQRVTLSLPKQLVFAMKKRAMPQGMSQFVATAIDKELKSTLDLRADAEKFVEELRKFRETAIPKTKKSSLEILREIRYGEKYQS